MQVHSATCEAQMASKDPDTEYMAGCLTAVAIAFVLLLIPVLRCILDMQGAKSIFTTSGLTNLLLQTSIPCAIVSILWVRWFKIAAACGSLGGWACGTAYWFLHLQQSIASAPAQIGQQTEYLDSTMWIVPACWLGLGFAVSFLPLPRTNAEQG